MSMMRDLSEESIAMKMPEYDELDGTALAALVKEGAVSPQELLEAAIERVEARNPALNAVVLKLYERAREKVSTLPDGPFHGIPFLLKDLKAALAGTPTSNSSRLSLNDIPTESSALVRRYEAAGLQIVGKTNTPEFGIMGVTESKLRGPCRNPWSLDHTPGGSSGGASSAVAARIVPFAHAGDGGGSIRIPASTCGLFGLKPTRGRVSQAPHRGESWRGFVQEHVVSRSVRDSAALLDISAGPEPGDPYAAPAKERPWLEEVGAPPGKLRVAFSPDPLYAGETHPDCDAALKDAAWLLESLGHEVEERAISFSREELVYNYFLTVAAGTASFVMETAARAGVKPQARDFESATWLLAQIGWKTDAGTYERTLGAVNQAARSAAAFFEDYDLFLSPTLAAPPAQIGELLPTRGDELQLALLRGLNSKKLLDLALDKMGTRALARSPNTQLFNQTGLPAMSVPLYWSSEGLPIGVQLATRFGDEATLFRVAAQLEEARPWAGRAGWERPWER